MRRGWGFFLSRRYIDKSIIPIRSIVLKQWVSAFPSQSFNERQGFVHFWSPYVVFHMLKFNNHATSMFDCVAST